MKLTDLQLRAEEQCVKLPNGAIVCRVRHADGKIRPEAIARLFAAAPEMMKALEDADLLTIKAIFEKIKGP